MKRDEIIKTLECCASSDGVSACESGCPLWEKDPCPCIDDPNAVLNYTLSLIKELTEDNENLYRSCTNLIQTIKDVQADTVRKMHSMLCEGRVGNDPVVIAANQVAEEMLEGSNEPH